ncbi:hypothetical protein [Rhodococcus koreensis]
MARPYGTPRSAFIVALGSRTSPAHAGRLDANPYLVMDLVLIS